MSRTKESLKIIGSNILIQIVLVICGLILPPMIIKEYHSEVNGLVNTVRQVVYYLSFISLGLGVASQVALYKPLSTKDWESVNGILSATRIYFNRIGYIYIFLIILTALIFPLLIKSSLSFSVIFAIIFIYGIGSVAEFIFLNKYKILLVADQKIYVVANINAQGFILNTLFSAILILFHSSIIFVQLVATLSYLFRLFFVIRYVKKKYPHVSFVESPKFEKIEDKNHAFFYQLSGMIISYTPIIIVSLFCGLKDASVFSVYNMVFFSLTMITSIFTSGFAATFGNIIAKNETGILVKSFEEFEYIYRLVLFFCYSSAIVLVAPFMSIYINNSDGVNYIIPILGVAFGVSNIFRALRVPFTTIVEAAGKFKENNLLNIIEAILNVILAIFMAKWYGLIGVLIASAISGLLRTCLYVLDVNRLILKSFPVKYFAKYLLNLLLVFVIFHLFQNIYVKNYFEWGKSAMLVSFVIFFSLFLLNSLLDIRTTLNVYVRIRLMVSNYLIKK